MAEFQLGNRTIGPNQTPFIIAELSGNHNQSLKRGLAIVDAMAAAGAHAIKLQTYTANTMTLRGAHRIDDPSSLWYGRELYELYEEAHTPWEWHKPLFDRARQHGMEAFSSPFDETAVDFLESLGVPAYKIASFENTDWPLLRRVAATGKPVIMSTGASTLAEMAEAVDVLRAGGCRELVLLKCTSTYPATPQNTNLRTIPHLQQLYPECLVGLSDHTMGVGASVAAVALGASVVEKHVTLRRADGGVDSAFSLEPEEVALLVTETERAWQALGQIQYGVQRAEEKSRLYKRSVYVAQDIAPGELFSRDNLRVVRPGDGLPPRYFEQVLGKPARGALAAGTPLSWEVL
ncbi:pseudaminic acid synthase [Hymenobacter busanensis]|uniref:Pseudaminic acid synthase n=1 Tax=Hymenobacter busanensis TaxID=2607656 RepID=A0A7L4ZX36_9BACT|nr:pseudaminic acid synthase [Hymenobacter busanensis]KAA9339460.1 pseudaminic acid synthase [Hymenobacter busanensis]QHJ06782.1 pseudaminic acid synthase [Hymenobacter busanensis]